MHHYLVASAAGALFLYVLTALLSHGYLVAHPGSRFGKLLGSTRHSALQRAFSLELPLPFLFRHDCGEQVHAALLTGFLFLFLDEFLMIFNLATGERQAALFAPIRHNLDIWAIPLFLGVYWSDKIAAGKAVKDIRGERLRSEAILAAIGDAITIQDGITKYCFRTRSTKLIGDHTGELCYQAYEKRQALRRMPYP